MSAPPPDPRRHVAAVASHLAIAATLLIVMWQGLLPGLLCVCVGFFSTRWLSPRMALLTRSPDRQSPRLAAAVMVLAPIVLLALFLPRTRGLLLDAPAQYRELLGFMARTVLDLRNRLPPDVAAQLPEGALEIQQALASYLVSKAGALATTGRAWLSGLLFAFVGLLIGALAAARPSAPVLGPLAAQLHLRVRRFGESFRRIIVAQHIECDGRILQRRARQHMDRLGGRVGMHVGHMALKQQFQIRAQRAFAGDA